MAIADRKYAPPIQGADWDVSALTKPIEHQFRDWEGSAFGYGYGTGEAYIIPALHKFMSAISEKGTYSHEDLEQVVSPEVAWLLINRLCAHGVDVIEYGTSPRFGWLTAKGKRLREFVLSKTTDDLYEIVAGNGEDYVHCYPDACNCGPSGYEEGRKCDNQFWIDQ